MTSIFSDDALHPGRDPNDSSWQILRRPHDWATATFYDTAYNPARQVLTLAPRPLAQGAAACSCILAPDGTSYCCDPDRDRVMRRGPCDAEYAPLPGFGGRGSATGRLDRPSGLALDLEGRLYVADTGNHRVQVVQPDDGSVVIVLGCTDGFGQPVAGTDHGAMTEPVAVAVAAHAIYVADRGGQRVHVFDRAFRFVRSFAPAPQKLPAGFVPSPIAVGVDTSGGLLVADAGWPALLRFGAGGAQLADLPYGDPAVPEGLDCLVPFARFASAGTVVVGPIDGLAENLAWHRVIVDAAIPPGATIIVQTYASDDPAGTNPIPWAPAAPVAMPDRGGGHDGALERPVLSDVGRWQRARHGEYLRGNPVIATYAGDGPNGVATLVLSGDGLARARAGDLIQLDATSGGANDRVSILSIPARTVQLAAAGTMASFGAGTPIVLLERDGVEPFAGPRTVYTLGAGETIDLSAIQADGTLAEISVLHAAAALWRRGDVISIGTATIAVADIRATPVAVTLSGTPAGDFSSSTVRIAQTTQRLFVTDATGLDAGVPRDEPITVGGLSGGAAWSVAAAVHWIEPDFGAVWLAPGTTLAWADWEDFTTGPGAATDRGRYLWLRLHLTGVLAHPDDPTATATPTIRSVRLLRPRLSYLTYLPAAYARRDANDPSGALFLERMLGVYERKLTSIEMRYESVARQLDPLAADPEWLAYLAGWFDLVLDPSLPLERRRLLVAEVHELYKIRGTPEGLRRFIEIVTGDSPIIVEGFQLRPASSYVLGATGVLGCTALTAREPSPAVLDQYAHRFTVLVFVLDPCQVEDVRAQLARLIDSLKPAHTLVDLRVVVPDARVEAQSTVGVDFVLGDGRDEPHVLGEAAEAGARPYPVLGLDAVLVPSQSSALIADDVGVRIDPSLRLE